uniref:Uncharacterized protein n=1 Tax=Cacopsylla melanoneura TaxID=428564 RepID=A0A8D8RPK1_9HEMI
MTSMIVPVHRDLCSEISSPIHHSFDSSKRNVASTMTVAREAMRTQGRGVDTGRRQNMMTTMMTLSSTSSGSETRRMCSGNSSAARHRSMTFLEFDLVTTVAGRHNYFTMVSTA